MGDDMTETPQDIPNFYVDSVRVNMSSWTLLLEFGLHDMPFDSEVSSSSPLVRLRMSPQHAKALAFIMIKTVENYESEHGEIQIPGMSTNVRVSGASVTDSNEEGDDDAH